MKTDLTFIRPLVENILSNPIGQAWTVQGFGFLRTYFGPPDAPKRFRLNLWDNHFTVPGVSTIHDHPWHFKSLIVAGAFCNVRYDISRENAPLTHAYTTIRTGEGGGMEKAPIAHCILRARKPELYTAGDTYHQDASEVHETIFTDGSVTFNERKPLEDGDHARVFWPFGESWVDAEPRAATVDEVMQATSLSLGRWFS
jgi:hypothetical protein